MDNRRYKSGFLAFLISGLIFFSGDMLAQSVSKKIEKEYPVTAETVLNIRNKFGKVDVRSWDQNMIRVEVTISAKHTQQEKAERIIEMISIREQIEGNQISLETVFDRNFGQITTDSWGSENKNFSIDYLLQIPSNLTLNLTNRFGDVFITELTGLVNIDIKFGRLEAHKILRGDEKPRSLVTLTHGQGFIDEANWLALNIKYYELDITLAQALLIESKHSEINVENVSSIVSESGYDKVRIGKLNNFVGTGSYTILEIDELTRKLELNTRYGRCVVDYIPPGFESISVKSSYTQSTLGIDPEATYTIEGKASFSDIKTPSNGKISRIKENTSLTISGTVGTGDPGESRVQIETRFGDVSLVR
ncbi:MAG TPA: hypothetical protein ENF21_01740 [Bacteroidetes bacterium]|nr:hypothetical protein [Bacteroidota bacterium]